MNYSKEELFHLTGVSIENPPFLHILNMVLNVLWEILAHII